MTVTELILELKGWPGACPVCFSGDLFSDEAKPIVDVAIGEDDTGEIVVITSDDVLNV